MRCFISDCHRRAKYQLGWRAWPLGEPKQGLTNAKTAILAVVACPVHSSVIRIPDMITRDISARINTVLANNHDKPLDFSTAEVVLHPLKDGKPVNILNPAG